MDTKIAIPGKVYKHKWTPSTAFVLEVKNDKVKVQFLSNGRYLTLPLKHFRHNFESEPVGEIWHEDEELEVST